MLWRVYEIREALIQSMKPHVDFFLYDNRMPVTSFAGLS